MIVKVPVSVAALSTVPGFTMLVVLIVSTFPPPSVALNPFTVMPFALLTTALPGM